MGCEINTNETKFLITMKIVEWAVPLLIRTSRIAVIYYAEHKDAIDFH